MRETATGWRMDRTLLHRPRISGLPTMIHGNLAAVKQQFLERVLPLAILALSVIAVPLLICSSSGLPRLSKLKAEKAQVAETVSRLSAEIRELRAEVERVKQDPTHVERAARDELGLVRRTDIVFQFQP